MQYWNILKTAEYVYRVHVCVFISLAPLLFHRLKPNLFLSSSSITKEARHEQPLNKVFIQQRGLGTHHKITLILPEGHRILWHKKMFWYTAKSQITGFLNSACSIQYIMNEDSTPGPSHTKLGHTSTTPYPDFLQWKHFFYQTGPIAIETFPSFGFVRKRMQSVN